jgi:type IV pilus assembly protein PilB
MNLASIRATMKTMTRPARGSESNSSGPDEPPVDRPEPTVKVRQLGDYPLPQRAAVEEALAEALAVELHLPYVRLAAITIDPEVTRLVSEELARKHCCLPLKKEMPEGQEQGRRPTLVLAMSNPRNLAAIQDVEFASGCSVKPVLSTDAEIRDALERYCSPESWLRSFLAQIDEKDDLTVVTPEGGGEESEVEPGKQAPAVKMVNLIIQHAIQQGASDIHVEPSLNDVLVRTRVQGILREFIKAPKWLHAPLISRLKILASLDISERRRPQDGRIRVATTGREVDLRLSILPTLFGEKAVVRVLDSGNQILSVDRLGADPGQLQVLRKAASQPQGIILVSGPTGSGKTTTLYALLNEKTNPSINIVTVEDPIELQLPGVSQVQVNQKAGLTFAGCLRSILRQDPDVIMVGEIRDLETAEIAFHAATTGHLVLSSIHTNSTVATIARLQDLGMDRYVVASSLNLVLAQRLVRLVCTRCKEAYTPADDVLARLHLERPGFRFLHGRGCEACGQTGYGRRVAIYEILRMTALLKELINRGAPEPELRRAAVAAGTSFLLEQALEKVKQGITTVEEVLRVIQLEEEATLACSKCGGPIHPESASCPLCLAPLKRACESCGQELLSQWRSCPYCQTVAGESLPAGAPPSAEIFPDPKAVPVPSGKVTTITDHRAPTKRPCILVVDDDELSRRLAVKALASLEARPEITEAASGIEALAAIERVKPDLVILDVMMPGMSGFELCQKLRSQITTAFIPILMLTGSVDEDSWIKGFLHGTDDYVGKPFSVPELHARVNRLLRRTYGL